MTTIYTDNEGEVRTALRAARHLLPNLAVIKTDTPLHYEWTIKLSRDLIVVDGTLPHETWLNALHEALAALIAHKKPTGTRRHLRLIDGCAESEPVQRTGTDGGT